MAIVNFQAIGSTAQSRQDAFPLYLNVLQKRSTLVSRSGSSSHPLDLLYAIIELLSCF